MSRRHPVEKLATTKRPWIFDASWALGLFILSSALSVGCIPQIDCCFEDEDCRDDSFCDGEEWCDCLCQAGEPPCAGGCDEETDTCLCSGPADCPDDGQFCNGAEFCNPAGTCGHSGHPCEENNPACPPCDESTDACLTTCTSDADCEDNNPCTIDHCDGCLCLNQPACPADCDSQTGECL